MTTVLIDIDHTRIDDLVAATALQVVHPSRRYPRAQQAILAKALSLLHRYGYAATTIEAIAEASGVAKTSIYRWWPSKAAIYLDLYCNLLPDSQFVQPGRPPDQALTIILTETLRAYRETGLGRAIPGVIADAQSNPEIYRKLVDGFVTPCRNRLIALIAAGCAAGCWHDRVDPVIATDQIIGAIWHCLIVDPTRLDASYATALTNQLRKPAP